MLNVCLGRPVRSVVRLPALPTNYLTTRAWYSGCAASFQVAEAGSIPAARSNYILGNKVVNEDFFKKAQLAYSEDRWKDYHDFSDIFFDAQLAKINQEEPAHCGMSCGPGWWPILNAAFDDIAKIIDEHPEVLSFKVAQIKEKFGTLRFYYDCNVSRNFSPDLSESIYLEISQVFRRAEELSKLVCDVCGEPGTLVGGGWIRTRCEKHV